MHTNINIQKTVGELVHLEKKNDSSRFLARAYDPVMGFWPGLQFQALTPSCGKGLTFDHKAAAAAVPAGTFC